MTKHWFVYLISEHGGQFCKIGRSSNVEKRLGYLRTSNPRKLEVVMTWGFKSRDDAAHVERVALRMADKLRLGRSEWVCCCVADAFRIVENAIDRAVGSPESLGFLA